MQVVPHTWPWKLQHALSSAAANHITRRHQRFRNGGTSRSRQCTVFTGAASGGLRVQEGLHYVIVYKEDDPLMQTGHPRVAELAAQVSVSEYVNDGPYQIM